jgi:hypothetical protein
MLGRIISGSDARAISGKRASGICIQSGAKSRFDTIAHTRHHDFDLNLQVFNRSARSFLLLPLDPVVAALDKRLFAQSACRHSQRPLDLLAGCPEEGCTETLMLARGFTIEQMVELVRGGLSTATPAHPRG